MRDLCQFFCAVGEVGFEQSMYSAVEGQSIAFTVVLNIEASFDVRVQFSTNDDTAMGKAG